MSNLHKALIHLVAFFRIGRSRASAENVTSFNPQTVEMDWVLLRMSRL